MPDTRILSIPLNALWEFLQGEDFQWRSHCRAADGSAVVSEPFADFGRCVSDAITRGFRADLHPYATRSNGKGSSHITWSQGATSARPLPLVPRKP